MSEAPAHSRADEMELRRRELIKQRQLHSHADDFDRWSTPIATAAELKWRHQHWWARREKIRDYLSLGWLGTRAYERFSNCGAMATVQWSKSAARHRVSSVLCKSRHCEPCMRQKAGRIANNLREKMKACPPGSFRFITLTLRHDELTVLADQLKRLIKHFRALRARPVWKRTQRGGAFTLEVKWTPKGWHAHLHAIAEGTWMDRDQLRDEWNQITGDSFQADIRRIQDADALAGYVVKYITKSTSPEVWGTPAVAKEYILAIKGTRTCATLGSWRGLKLTEPKNLIDDWQHVSTLESVLNEARAGQAWAEAITISLRPPADNTEHKPHRRLARDRKL